MIDAGDATMLRTCYATSSYLSTFYMAPAPLPPTAGMVASFAHPAQTNCLLAGGASAALAHSSPRSQIEPPVRHAPAIACTSHGTVDSQIISSYHSMSCIMHHSRRSSYHRPHRTQPLRSPRSLMRVASYQLQCVLLHAQPTTTTASYCYASISSQQLASYDEHRGRLRVLATQLVWLAAKQYFRDGGCEHACSAR